MLNHYREVLGVGDGATLNAIKKAYRLKAKQLHPDLNQAADAEERFIELNEAYEYLQKYKTGRVYSNRSKQFEQPKKRRQSHAQWVKEERERARVRARQMAKMRYAQYIKSDYYKRSTAVNVLGDFLTVYGLATLIAFGPVFGQAAAGEDGLNAAFSISGILLVFAFTQKIPELDYEEFWPSLRRVLKYHGTHYFLLGSLNLFIFLFWGLNTLLPFVMLLGLLLGPMVLIYAAIKMGYEKPISKYISYGIGPGVFSLVLVLNSWQLAPLKQETYAFKIETYKKRGGDSEDLTYIHLKDGEYGQYQHLRYFLNYDRLRGKKYVTYHVARGALGIEVVTQIDLTYKVPELN